MSESRKWYIRLVRFGMYLATAMTALLTLFIVAYVLIKGIPNLSWEFVSTKPSYLSGNIGILPDILNTVYIVIATLIIVIPLGVGAAVYLTEYARNHRLVQAMEFAAETLSGIPSILYALIGLLIFSQFLGLQKTLLAASLTLAVMNLPTIIRTTQESLKTVPVSWREGSLGLGAGKWHMIRTVVLPSAVDGILTGCILAVGRIVGESAVLLYIAGMGTALNDFLTAKGFFSGSGSTLTVMLYVYAKERSDFELAFAVAVILLFITLGINLTATAVAKRMKRR